MFFWTTAGFLANVVSNTDASVSNPRPSICTAAPTATVFCMTGSLTESGARSGTGSPHNWTPAGGS